jgi:hypothetical protein
LKIIALLHSGATLAAAPPVIRTEYHLTAGPWQPLNIDKSKYLDVTKGSAALAIGTETAVLMHQD